MVQTNAQNYLFIKQFLSYIFLILYFLKLLAPSQIWRCKISGSFEVLQRHIPSQDLSGFMAVVHFLVTEVWKLSVDYVLATIIIIIIIIIVIVIVIVIVIINIIN